MPSPLATYIQPQTLVKAISYQSPCQQSSHPFTFHCIHFGLGHLAPLDSVGFSKQQGLISYPSSLAVESLKAN